MDGMAAHRLAPIDELLDQLDTPHRIVTESTFESWRPDRRQPVAARAASEGHVLEVVHPLQAERMRAHLELAKSDENDARAIFAIAQEGRVHTYGILAPDQEWAKFRVRANREYNRLRKGGGKADLLAQAKAILGPFGEQSRDAQAALGNRGKYSEALICACYFAALRCTSRGQYERLLGLHGSAYPSLLRSEVHQHSAKYRVRHEKNPNGGLEWTVYRRELRRLFARFKAARPRPDVDQRR